ncbi:MAG TPA: maltose acetyltransferase domain-containing protein [Bacteroidales bacterium]|nr:maltose acetyltransferase domain-containing protein [Bacteroidales bacterium]
MGLHKQNMLAGKLYKAFDEELFAERKYAKEQIYKFNSLVPSELQQRNEIIRSLFGKTKENFFIEPPFRCDYGYSIEIGENFYANYNLTSVRRKKNA